MNALDVWRMVIDVQDQATELMIANLGVGQTIGDLELIIADASLWLDKFGRDEATLEGALKIVTHWNNTWRDIHHLRWHGNREMIDIARIETTQDVSKAIQSVTTWVNGLEEQTIIALGGTYAN